MAISEDKTAHIHIMSAKDFARLAEFDQKADEGEMRRQGGTGEKLVSMYDVLAIKSEFCEAMLDAGVGTWKSFLDHKEAVKNKGIKVFHPAAGTMPLNEPVQKMFFYVIKWF